MQTTFDYDDKVRVPPNVDTPGYCHSNAGPTEESAARLVRKGRGEKQMRMLAAYAEAAHGLSDFEIEAKCNMLAQSVTSCRNSLIENGYVTKTTMTRPGRAQWPVRVWEITSAGRKALQDAGSSTPIASASCTPRDAA